MNKKDIILLSSNISKGELGRTIDKLMTENRKLKEENIKLKAIAKEYETRWLNSYSV